MEEETLNIDSAVYFKNLSGTKNISIIMTISGQDYNVPLDPANRHYAEILRQVEAGTLTIQEAE